MGFYIYYSILVFICQYLYRQTQREFLSLALAIALTSARAFVDVQLHWYAVVVYAAIRAGLL